MKLYFAHSSEINYKEIYSALEGSFGKDHELILPHKSKAVNSKDTITSCDLFIAECSLPSTGMGVEIGWANAADVPVVFVYKKGIKISSSLKFVSKEFIEYTTLSDLVEKLEKYL